jgi:cysteinyl-tRNA synthetase
LLFLQSHYSSELDINIKGLQDAEKNLRKLLNAAKYLEQLTQPAELKPDAALDEEVRKLCVGCKEHMDDDFNTAKLVANLLQLATHINTMYNNGRSAAVLSVDTYNLLQKLFPEFLFDVLGLRDEQAGGDTGTVDQLMQLIIDIRKSAREQKDFATSDKIRDALKAANIVLKDSKEGTTYEIG